MWEGVGATEFLDSFKASLCKIHKMKDTQNLKVNTEELKIARFSKTIWQLVQKIDDLNSYSGEDLTLMCD